MSEHQVLTWATYRDASRELGRRPRASAFAPDLGLGIARRGLVLAASLAYGGVWRAAHRVSSLYD